MLVILLAFFPLISGGIYTSDCVPTCASIFRNSVTSILGNPKYSTAPLFAPIHEIIASSRNIRAAVRRINWTCFAMNRYENCLRQCEYSKAKSVRLVGNRHWTVVCEAVKTPNFTDYAQCQQSHQGKVRSRCGLLQLPASISLKSFCRRLLKYRSCYLQIPSNCSVASYKFWKSVDDMLGETHNKLLNVYAAPRRIPQQCRWKLSHFGRKHKTKSSSTSSSSTTTATTTTYITLATTTTIATTVIASDELDGLIEAIDHFTTTCPPFHHLKSATLSTKTSKLSLIDSVKSFIGGFTSNARDAQRVLSSIATIVSLIFVFHLVW